MVVSLSVDCPGHAFRHLSSRFEVAALQAVCPCVMLFVSCLVSSSSQRPDPETLVMLCVDVMLCVADPVSFFCPLHCVLLSTAVTLPVWILPGSNLPVMTPISSIASRSVFVTRHTHEHADYDAVRRQSSLSQFQALSLPRVHVAARRPYITLRGKSTVGSTRPPLGTQPSAPAAQPHLGPKMPSPSNRTPRGLENQPTQICETTLPCTLELRDTQHLQQQRGDAESSGHLPAAAIA